MILTGSGRPVVFESTIDFASCGANTLTTMDFAVPGVEPGMLIMADIDALNAGLTLCHYRVKTAGTITLGIYNNTGGALDPDAGKAIRVVAI